MVKVILGSDLAWVWEVRYENAAIALPKEDETMAEVNVAVRPCSSPFCEASRENETVSLGKALEQEERTAGSLFVPQSAK